MHRDHGGGSWQRACAVWGALLGAAACSPSPAPTAAVSPMDRELQVVEDVDRRASREPVPESSTVFDGQVVRLVAARGEVLGLTVWQRDGAAVALGFAGPEVSITGFEVEWAPVRRPSTTMYGGSRGAGRYVDGLVPAAAPRGTPVYFDLAVSADATPRRYQGTLSAAGRRVPVELDVVDVRLPAVGVRPRVWAYYDPRELAWQHGLVPGAPLGGYRTLPLEERCAAMFRRHGVLATPMLAPDQWAERAHLFTGMSVVPVLLPQERTAAQLAQAARFWQGALGEDQLAFVIPIDEPRRLEQKRAVRQLAEQVGAARAATGTDKLRFAVTDRPHPIYGDHIDIYISPRAVSRRARTGPAARAMTWTYNGNPPFAGSMVLDAGNADLRTWGWIGWRWDVPLWYIWDALYWHDRHNAKRRGLPRPGRAMALDDAVTFDDGEDHGNRDGVLALPGPHDEPCRPTLRLKTLRRGLQDRLLLEAASCASGRARAARLAARLVPYALGDAASTAVTPAIPSVAWSEARRELLELAEECQREDLSPR